ncbi:hypothetical protein CEXT_201861 [Caerostris extrusa]|uniref:Uncharacterized protein n=1 Tax=Caerostris extrusa TaxID=172846 RepID=A0AAV4T3Q9_CAEEX|nr:hypothetical protein CEXT_201861 [Caerostris extrusa]
MLASVLRFIRWSCGFDSQNASHLETKIQTLLSMTDAFTLVTGEVSQISTEFQVLRSEYRVSDVCSQFRVAKGAPIRLDLLFLCCANTAPPGVISRRGRGRNSLEIEYKDFLAY